LGQNGQTAFHHVTRFLSGANPFCPADVSAHRNDVARLMSLVCDSEYSRNEGMDAMKSGFISKVIATFALTFAANIANEAAAVPLNFAISTDLITATDHIATDIAYRRGGVARRTTVVGPRGGVARRTTVARGTVVRPGWHGAGTRWSRPGWYGWPVGGAIAAGAAIGVVSATAAAAWAGAPPAPGMCWYYTDPSKTQGFWDYCR
jgi:hypothetical protein